MASTYRNCQLRDGKTVMVLDGKEIVWDCPGHECPCPAAQERERCALIAENYATLAPSSEFVVQTTMEVAAECIAETIRGGPRRA